MESVAAPILKSRNIRRLIFASHDNQLVSAFRAVIEPCGIEVMSLTDVGLPEPSGSTRGTLDSATRKAAVVAAITNTPASGYARGFYIDPLLRWGGGGPKWAWPIPWPYKIEDLAAELRKADHQLGGQGYCGPDDRGAYFRTLLCIVWPDAQSLTFEGRIPGQFITRGRRNKPRDLVYYFVPDGETAPVALLADEARQHFSDQEQAFEAFRKALSA